jgi:integration host factor subunit alpha
MTKKDLVDKINMTTDLTQKESAGIVECVFDLIKSTLEDGERLKIAGFGNFEVKEKTTRRGRNPQTGDVIEIAARKVLTFKPSQVLKQTINSQDT